MTVETRWMRSDTQTINGLLAYKLALENTTSYLSASTSKTSSDQYPVYWASDVVVRHADGSETTLAEKIAMVTRTTNGAGIQSATWACPQTALVITDAIVIRVYIKIDDDAWYLATTFITEQLGAVILLAATWTFNYYTARTTVSTTMTFGIFNRGGVLLMSYIENFSWSSVLAVPRSHGYIID